MNELLGALGANGQLLTLPHVEYFAIMPELVLGGGAAILLLLSSLVRERLDAKLCAAVTIVLSLAAMLFAQREWHDLKDGSGHSVFAGAMALDHFSLFFVVVISVALILSALVSSDWLSQRNMHGPEFYVLMMMSATGAMIMAAANDLIVVFLGLEILSIALYVLVGIDRKSEASREASIKYFILGGFSSAIFLYGIALTYGATGSTNLSVIAAFLAADTLKDYGLLIAGMGLLLVGFAFKIAAVPFHNWTPDVYQGAPTPVTAFMSAAAKAGAFAALLRVFASTFYSMKLDWQPMILALAILTLLVGSIVACVQLNVKRMLAYSSISHAGYVLLGLQAASLDGISASLYYLLAYTFMVVGSFAIVALVGGQDDSKHGLEAFRGLSKRNPILALSFAVLLLAQAGVPLTSGFIAKFSVISALVANGSYATAVFAMVIAAVAAFFYLRIAIAMYSDPDVGTEFDPGESGLALVGSGGPAIAVAPSPTHSVTAQRIVVPAATGLAIGLAVVFTVGLGVLPPAQTPHHWILNAVRFARLSAAGFFTS